MSDTHLNVFVTEFENAYKEAVGAIDTFYQKAKALGVKYESELKKLAPEIQSEIQKVEQEVTKGSKSKTAA